MNKIKNENIEKRLIIYSVQGRKEARKEGRKEGRDEGRTGRGNSVKTEEGNG